MRGGDRFCILTVPDYVLYFGRYSEEKGIRTLLEVCRALPEVQFVFAGKGPLENEVNALGNIENVGFRKGDPFSVIESLMLGTPVLGADIGGIPELIQAGKTGELFESGNVEALKAGVRKLWDNRTLAEQYSRNCGNAGFDDLKAYAEKLVQIYGKE